MHRQPGWRYRLRPDRDERSRGSHRRSRPHRRAWSAYAALPGQLGTHRAKRRLRLEPGRTRAWSRLAALGIEPVLHLLHHGSGPAGYESARSRVSRSGSPASPGRCAERYPWVTHFVPINEPVTTARFSTLYGLWYPHLRDIDAFFRAVWNQCRAIQLGMRAIRDVSPRTRPASSPTTTAGCTARLACAIRPISTTHAAGSRSISSSATSRPITLFGPLCDGRGFPHVRLLEMAGGSARERGHRHRLLPDQRALSRSPAGALSRLVAWWKRA